MIIKCELVWGRVFINRHAHQCNSSSRLVCVSLTFRKASLGDLEKILNISENTVSRRIRQGLLDTL